MKTSLNLYPTSCHPKKVHLNFKQLMMLLLIGIGLSMAITLLLHMALKRDNNHLIDANSDLLRLEKQFSSLVASPSNRHPKSYQNKQIQALEHDISQKQHLLAHLGEIDLSEKLSFPKVMAGIADANKDGVTLTQLNIIDDQLSFQGTAVKSTFIPRWLMALEQRPELAGISFNHIDIHEVNGAFIFQLNAQSQDTDRGQ